MSQLVSQNRGFASGPVERRAGAGITRTWSIHDELPWSSIEVAPGEILYREGAFADRVYAVQTGIVKRVAHLPNGRVRILGLHGPGAILGFVTPASGGGTYQHTGMAVSEVKAEWAPVPHLRRIRSECSPEYLRLLERHCEELRNAERWITEFSADTTTCRIARVIRYLAELQQLPEPDSVELLTCQEMAEVIGVSTESASRVLARFKRGRVLIPFPGDRGGRRYRFDRAALDDIAFT